MNSTGDVTADGDEKAGNQFSQLSEQSHAIPLKLRRGGEHHSLVCYRKIYMYIM